MLDTVMNFLNGGLLHAGWLFKVIYFLIVTQLTIFAVTLYLHRSACHRGVDFHPVVTHVLRLWTWLSTGMITREWVAVHRKHHAKCETEEDPHSPKFFGVQTVLWKGVDLYRVASLDEETLEKYGKGCPDDWIERHVYSAHAYWGPTLTFIINIALFGIWGLAISALQMIWIPFWAAGVVNGIGHWWGYRNFETSDMATNLSPWGVWIGGEELHNNHHAFPSSAKFALRKFEVDIGWGIICALRAVGLAKVLRVAPTLDVRANVSLPDGETIKALVSPPTLDVRANVSLPDGETIKALVSHKFEVMSDYFRGVILPTLREDAKHAGAGIAAIPRALRRALGNGGRWLDEHSRQKMQALVENRPTLRTVCDFRARLATVLERNSGGAEAMMNGLTEWCREAEASGIQTLAAFAARLRGYTLAPVRT